MTARLTAADYGLLTVALGLTAFAFLSVLRVAFHHDDLVHLYQIENFGPLGFLLKMHGGHLYITRNAVFLLFHALFGPNPVPYMWSAYLTHLLNVGLLFVVSRRLSGSRAAAGAAAILWGSSPNNAGTVAWYSVFGQALAVTLILWLLWRLLQVADGQPFGRGMAWRWGLLLCAAAAAFGTGLAMALAMPGVAWLLLPPTPIRRRLVTAFAVAVTVLLAVYVGVEHVETQRFGGSGMSTLAVGSTWLWLGRVQFVFHLLGVGIPSLLLGAFFLPTQYPSPLAWALLAAFAAALMAAWCLAPDVLRRRLLAALLLAFACYGMIAVGRSFFADMAGLWSVVRPTRYHYAAPIGLALALAVIVRVLADGAAARRSAVAALLATWFGVVGLANAVAAPPIDVHAGSRHRIAETLAAIRGAVAAAPPGQPVYIPNGRFYPHLLPGVELRFHGTAAVYAIYFPDDVVDGRRVYFVESDPKIYAATRAGRRSAALVVAPDAVPAGAPPLLVPPPAADAARAR